MTSQALVFFQRGTKEGAWCGWCIWVFLTSLHHCGCSQSLCQEEEPFPLLLLHTNSQLFSPALTEGANKSKQSPDYQSSLSPGDSSVMLPAHCSSFVSAGTSPIALICLGELVVFVQHCSCPQQILSLPRRRLGCCPPSLPSSSGREQLWAGMVMLRHAANVELA